MLEPRMLLYSTLANGMPILNSRPSAPAAIYLDFNAETSYGSQGFSLDSDFTTYNAAEEASIYNCWQQVSVYYAMFDVNVTTIEPNVYAVPTAWDCIGNNISGGYTTIGGFGGYRPYSFNESSDAINRASGIAHELGHNFGLDHQSSYDLSGSLTAEYSGPSDALHGKLMGLDYAGTIHKWTLGHPDWSPSILQDDMQVIAYAIKFNALNGYAGDGYAPHDPYGSTITTATPLTVNSDGSQSISGGVIARLSDTDAFSFTVSTAGQYLIAVTPDAPSGLDPKLSIYKSGGKLLGVKDGDPLSQPLRADNNKQLTLTLAPGAYYAVVGSHGNYDDVGEYDLSIAPYSGTPYPSDPLTRPRGTAVTNLNVSTWSAYPSDLILNWTDASWETGYEIERSPNGAGDWTVLATVGQNVPSYTDKNLAAGTRYYYQVVTVDASGDAATSAVAYGTTLGGSGNAAPTVATSAAAAPSVVTGTSTSLGVLGADDRGEPNLTYTWLATSQPDGVAVPTFTVNGTNAAKNTTATFYQAGNYTFQVTIADARGLTVTSSVTVTVNQTLTSIIVTPAAGALDTSQTEQFSASGNDQFGNVLASQPTFAWAVGSGLGVIDPTGLYTAPATGGSATITATSGAVSQTVPITVTPIAIWNGSVSVDLSNPANWVGGLVPVPAVYDLHLAGQTEYSPFNDFPAGTNFNDLTFNGNCALSGNSATLDSTISNTQGNNTVLLPLVFADDGLFQVSSGSLTVGGTVNNGGHLLTVSTAAVTTATITGSVSGSGSLVKSGAGTLALTGPNSYSGSTTVLGGTLQVTSANAIPTGTALVVGSNATAIFGAAAGPAAIAAASSLAQSGSPASTTAIPALKTSFFADAPPVVAVPALPLTTVIAPEGHLIIAQRFIAGKRVLQIPSTVPEGRLNVSGEQVLNRPSGTARPGQLVSKIDDVSPRIAAAVLYWARPAAASTEDLSKAVDIILAEFGNYSAR